MAEFMAVCRKRGETTPQKMNLTAGNVISALDKMIEIAGVATSSDLDAFELLEIIDDGKAYVPVASKDEAAKARRMETRASRSRQLLTGPCTNAEGATCEELLYTNYEVESA